MKFLTFWICCLALAISSAAQETGTPKVQKPTAYYVETRELSPHWKFLLESVEGLANQKSPSLFLVERHEDMSWLRAMQTRFDFVHLSADEALDRFADAAPQVIWDATRPWTMAIATTLAGLHHALLTDRDLGEGHLTAFDCRNHWTNKVEAYRWAMTGLLPQCERQRFVYLDDSLPFLRDLAIEKGMFVINLDPLNESAEIKLLNEVLAKFPAQSIALGWSSGKFADCAKGQDAASVERAWVRRLSDQNKLSAAADFAGNLSFFGQIKTCTPALKQQRLQRGLKFQPGKLYVLLMVSEGDNVQYNLYAMRRHWKEPGRPLIPLGWTISPLLVELAPFVMQTYYQEAAERGGWDEFVAGPSGYAQVNPSSMAQEQLGKFVDLTQAACEQADLHSIAVFDESSRPGAEVMRFIEAYAQGNFDGLWLAGGLGCVGVSGQTAFLNESLRLGKDGARAARELRQMKLEAPFVFVYVCEGDMSASGLNDFVASLDKDCVLVSPTEMADLLRQWKSQP